MFYNDINEAINNLIHTGNQLLNTKVEHKKYGAGNIIETKVSHNEGAGLYGVMAEYGLTVVVEFEVGTKSFDLKTIYNNKNVSFEKEDIVVEVLSIITTCEDMRLQQLNQIQLKLKADEDKRLEEEKKKREELKNEARKEKALAKLNTAKPESLYSITKEPATQLELVGWMAKHVKSIKAAMPDYMESWFVSTFGDVLRTVVDSKKRTTGGFPMQWGLSMAINFDKEVPDLLKSKATSQNKCKIDNLGFVWNLIDNYGFKFGKEQDLDEIMKNLSTDELEAFTKGMAM